MAPESTEAVRRGELLAGPPLGYRPLALAAVAVNLAAMPWLVVWITAAGPMATATLVVGLAAILPALLLGLIAGLALLARRAWGPVLAVVAHGVALAVALAYGIVWVVLVPSGRLATGLGLGGLWVVQLLGLIYWCRPCHRAFLLASRGRGSQTAATVTANP